MSYFASSWFNAFSVCFFLSSISFFSSSTNSLCQSKALCSCCRCPSKISVLAWTQQCGKLSAISFRCLLDSISTCQSKLISLSKSRSQISQSLACTPDDPNQLSNEKEISFQVKYMCEEVRFIKSNPTICVSFSEGEFSKFKIIPLVTQCATFDTGR
ncbi:Hypothetical_protein [Hexamita inflata]|uniref:Hypothetical_protein n=1 Tax=Hexamita inflata TaxID=28002 RepID=A0AA86NDV0_9EUKA|nr:Hypothetical protein HINF_LOCUS5171 [Hexamita inflata]